MKILYPTIRSLCNMIREMDRKNLELKRITKTSSLLILSGLSPNSIPHRIINKVVTTQNEDGGWISIVDTMWNIFFLSLINDNKFSQNIQSGKIYLLKNRNKDGLWGRSIRDMSRIPVTAILLYLFPELNINNEINKLEKLWISELNSIVYKAGYTLMAFKKLNYNPKIIDLINITIEWLIKNQRDDGGFAPWLNHPIESDVFCTSIATLGLLQFFDNNLVPITVLQKAYQWLIENRLKSGIWKYHEIDDGASWGLITLAELNKAGIY